MGSTIRRVAVLGSETMGAGIAAHCANIGLQVFMLDIAADALTPEEQRKGLSLEHPLVRNRIVKTNYERMVKSHPAALVNAAAVTRIKIGYFTNHFEWVREADWVVEAIVEQLEPKQQLMARVETYRKPSSIISSNTSGFPLHLIAEGRRAEFKRHFLGMVTMCVGGGQGAAGILECLK